MLHTESRRNCLPRREHDARLSGNHRLAYPALAPEVKYRQATFHHSSSVNTPAMSGRQKHDIQLTCLAVSTKAFHSIFGKKFLTNSGLSSCSFNSIETSLNCRGKLFCVHPFAWHANRLCVISRTIASDYIANLKEVKLGKVGGSWKIGEAFVQSDREV